MDRFFHPKSIAVVGVSPKPTNMARHILYNLERWEFEGDVYAVGPSGGEINGRKIYRSLEELPRGIDLAVFLTPARIVPDLIEICGRRGIGRVLIESGGFGEYSSQSTHLEEAVLEAARRHSIRIIGPNGIGIIYAKRGLVLPFSPIDDELPEGGISILSQSGGVGIHLMLALSLERQGLSKIVSLGNKLDVNEVDLLEYLLEDDETTTIGMYLEGLADGRRLMELASKAKKPIVVLKSNTGKAGARAAQSHTKALSSDDSVVSAAFEQAGILRAGSTNEFINSIKALGQPPMHGNRVAVVSRSGGHAIIVADCLERAGLEMPPFSESTLEVARKALRADVIHLQNPLDVGDIFEFEAYSRIVESILEDDQHDGVLLLHTFRDSRSRETSRRMMCQIEQLAVCHQKPIATCLVTGPEELSEIRRATHLPIYETPEEAAQALAITWNAGKPGPRPFNAAPPASRFDDSVLEELNRATRGQGWLKTEASLEILKLAGISMPRWAIPDDAESAANIAARWGCPVVLKALTEDVLHKTDVGAVVLDLSGHEVVRTAYDALLARSSLVFPGVSSGRLLLQEHAPEGLEVILGARRDPNFGPVIVFGLGGVTTEILDDVAIRVAPVDSETAREMICSLRSSQLIKGYRSRPACDIDAMVGIICLISDLMSHCPQIEELDINPLRLYQQGLGARALDVRVRVNGN